MTYHGVDSPTLTATHLEIWQILKGAVDGLPDNDFGRPWPAPRGDMIALALTRHAPDLCIRAARQAREIVQAQDRAPNISGLFEKKLRDLAEVRATVRESLEAA